MFLNNKEHDISDLLLSFDNIRYQGAGVVSLILNREKTPNTLKIIVQRPCVFGKSVNILTDFSSEELGKLVENSDMYSIVVKIGSGTTNSKQLIEIFDKRDEKSNFHYSDLLLEAF